MNEAALDVASRTPALARRMADAALHYLDSLLPRQREQAAFPFESDQRFAWHWVPFELRPRYGLRLVHMTPMQQARALALAATGLSPRAFQVANTIRTLDGVLRAQERGAPDAGRAGFFLRDPELYSFAVFGQPGAPDAWGWSAAGHHLALNFTIVDSALVAGVPLFFGANPAQVRQGPLAGHRTLPDEEDLARALLRSLEPAQRAVAIVKSEAPADLLTEPTRRADPAQVPLGLPYRAMTGEQRQQLVRLIRVYVDRACEEVAAQEWRMIEHAGLDELTFAWMGGGEPGQGHYYAIRGPRLLIEYDNIQDGANHQHTVWRDLTNDFGADLLAAHYAHSPHHAGSTR
jgi:hypothetical protein